MIDGAKADILAFKELGLYVKHIASKNLFLQNKKPQAGPIVAHVMKQNSHGRVHRGC
jgi:hypothetical protein